MKNKTFWIVFLCVIALCLILTIAHFIYTACVYGQSSIIYFIGKEMWV